MTTTHQQLVVIPIEGRELMSRDQLTRRSDPFCIMKYGDLRHKTRTIDNTLHPVWSWSLFAFDHNPFWTEVTIEVWDRDKGRKHDALGEVTILLDTAKPQVIDQWLDLQPNYDLVDKHNKGHSHPLGKIHVRIYDRIPVPAVQDEPLGKSIFLYEEFPWRQELKTGDCILFSGSETVSGIIKKFMHTPYSHCGLVLRMKDPLTGKDDEVFVAEADWDDGDYLAQESIYGIAINRFEDRMKTYVGDVIWHCPLIDPLNADEAKIVVDYVMDSKAKKVKYDMVQGLRMMAKIKNRESASSVFCSELVAFAAKKAKRTDPNLNCSEQDPYMVAKLPCFAGQFPKTVLRYQVFVDRAKLQGAGISEIFELIKPKKKKHNLK
jgi:hypothetical protein